MRAWLISVVSVACAVCVLEAFAEPPRRTIDVSHALDASLNSDPSADMAIAPTPADPPPLVERGQWVFDLRWSRGEPWLLGVHELQLAVEQATPRAMGRFALELFEGRTLVERVRFDFPLLGASEPDAAISLVKKLDTRIGVIFPATKRGTRLELWDRATNRRWSLPWPASSGTHSGDAGILFVASDAAQRQ